MPKPILNQINLVCADVSASIAFYRRLGVDIPETDIWRTSSGPHHANADDGAGRRVIAFDLDSTAFAERWNSSWTGRTDLGGRVVIGFGLPSRSDVDAVYRDMTGAGYRSLEEPHDAFWGARYAIIEDPDGIAVGLMSPVSAEQKTPPPDL